MATQIPSTFTQYQLTPEEQQSAQTLTTLNLQHMQNLICDAAEKRIAMTLDPNNPVAYAQEAAELQGQIGILKYLVELSQLSNPSLVINS
jgi:hypothetical protein